jgi:hypothetical protein
VLRIFSPEKSDGTLTTGPPKVYARFWWGNLRKIDHFEDPGIDGKIILK